MWSIDLTLVDSHSKLQYINHLDSTICATFHFCVFYNFVRLLEAIYCRMNNLNSPSNLHRYTHTHPIVSCFYSMENENNFCIWLKSDNIIVIHLKSSYHKKRISYATWDLSPFSYEWSPNTVHDNLLKFWKWTFFPAIFFEKKKSFLFPYLLNQRIIQHWYSFTMIFFGRINFDIMFFFLDQIINE